MLQRHIKTCEISVTTKDQYRSSVCMADSLASLFTYIMSWLLRESTEASYNSKGVGQSPGQDYSCMAGLLSFLPSPGCFLLSLLQQIVR